MPSTCSSSTRPGRCRSRMSSHVPRRRRASCSSAVSLSSSSSRRRRAIRKGRTCPRSSTCSAGTRRCRRSAGSFSARRGGLHPSICRYTSDLFYEGKLQPHAGLANQAVSGPTRFAGAGLFFVPVEHEGNQNVSVEEVAEVVDIVRDLLQPGTTWTDRHGEARPLTLADILIVAPYNAQVSGIAERLPGARVGTVRQVPGAGSASRHLLDGYVELRGRSPRDGVSLQPQPPQRRDVASAVRLHSRRQPAPVRAGVSDPGADEDGERVLRVLGESS